MKKINRTAASKVWHDLRSGKDSKIMEGVAEAVAGANPGFWDFSKIVQKIAENVDEDVWFQFLVTRELPPIKLTQTEMQILKGGSPLKAWGPGVGVYNTSQFAKAGVGGYSHTEKISGRTYTVRDNVEVVTRDTKGKVTSTLASTYNPHFSKMESIAKWWFKD